MATRIQDRVVSEQRHAAAILADGEKNWGWNTPAGQVRLSRRMEFLSGAPCGRSGRVLELGAGTGTYTGALAHAYDRTHAIEIAADLLKVAQGRVHGVSLCCMDAHALAFAEGVFDAVVGCSILHHLDLTAALACMFRVLKPGGVVRFSEPNLLNPHVFLIKKVPFLKRLAGESPGETAYSARQMRDALATAGFVDVRVEPYEFLHPATPARCIPAVMALERFLSRTAVRAIAGSLRIEAARPL